MKVPLIIAIIVFVGGAHLARISREILHGPCYNVATSPAIDLQKWTSGKWFEMARYRASFEDNTDCVSQVYFLNAPQRNIQINFSLRFPDQIQKMVQASVNYTLSESEYAMTVTFPQDSTESTFDILATDTDNYAIVYSCWQFSKDPSLPEKQERLWVLSRTRSFSNETAAVVETALRFNGTDLSKYLDYVPQTDCP